MSENLSPDAIALRREARRRRILENAESRLRTITGKERSSYDEPKPNIFHSLHHVLPTENSSDPLEEINQEMSSEENILKELSGLKETFQYNDEPNVPIKTPMKKSCLEVIVQNRLHYIMLSLLIHILLFFKLGFLFYSNLFCPFITVKLMEYTLVQTSVESPQQNVLSLVTTLFKGHHVLTYIFKTYSILKNFCSDFFLYMFIFILSDKLFNAINELYIT